MEVPARCYYAIRTLLLLDFFAMSDSSHHGFGGLKKEIHNSLPVVQALPLCQELT